MVPHFANTTPVIAEPVTLGALVMSRTVGLFGFTEKVWTTDAIIVTGAEVGAIVALTMLAVMRQHDVHGFRRAARAQG